MSKQWTIENDTGAELIVRAPNGFAVELDASSADPRERFAYFAIHQQASDIAELEVFAEIGRQWNADSSLAKWFPLTAERVERDAQEIAKLRTDLAAAVSRAEQAEARLAAIDGAPTVAMLCPLTESAFNESTLMTAYQKAKMPHVELIARPAKD